MNGGRTILTFATGAPQYRTMATALAISLRLHGSRAARTIVTDTPDDPELADLFDHRILPPPNFNHWFIKLCGLQETEFDEFLFIDGDCLAVRNVDALFDEMADAEFAVQGMWLSDPGNWYGDIRGAMARLGVTKIPKFSGGFLYYQRTDRAAELIQEIMALADRYDELGLERNGGKVVDEVCIALAMAKTGIGTVVSDSQYASTTPWYRVGPLELDVVGGRCSFLRRMPYGLELAKPAIYHTAMAKWDLAYWREVRKLLRAYRCKIAPEMGPGAWPKIRRKWRRIWVELIKRLP